MGTPGPTPEVTLTDVLTVFTAQGRPGTPLTATEVAEELDCTRRTAHRKLTELRDRGDLNSKKTGAHSRVWWRSSDRSPGAGTAAGSGATEASDATPADAAADERWSELAQFGDFVDAVSDYAIFMLDPDGVVASWNRGAARIKGYDESEIVGEHFSVFYTDEAVDDDVPAELLATAREEGRVEREGWRERADGSRFWANVTITTVRDDEGTLLGFTKVTRDLTERREYEQALKAERDLLDRTLDASPVGIIITDPDGEAVRINDGAAELLGFPDEADREAYTPGDRQIYDEDGRPLAREEHPFARALETGESVYDEVFELERPDGTRRWLSVNAVPLVTEGGDVERVVSTGDDVTELKRRTRELESELSEVLGRISDAFYALDEEWRFTHVNDRAADLLQRPADELLGESIWETFPEAAAGGFREQYERAMETKESVSFEQFDESLDAWFEINAYPSETGLSVYFRDVTGRKERERRLSESEQRYRTLVEHFPNGAVTLVDEDLTYRTVGGSPLDAAALPAGEIEGKRVDEVLPTEVADDLASRYEAALAGESSTLERELEEGIYQFQFVPVRDDTGDVFAAMGMSQDVTERNRRERELERFRTIVETVDDGVYTVDDEGRFTMVNEAYAELTGYSREELVGSHVSLVISEAVAARARDIESGMRAGDEVPEKVEADLATADGGTVTAEATFAMLPDGEDDAERVGVVRDISERKAYERALEESERRYRTLAEQFPNGVVALFDEDLRYTAAGGEFLDEMDIDPDETVGDSIFERYPEHIIEEVEPHFRGALDGDHATFEVEYLGRHLQAHTLPVRNRDGDIFAGMLMVQDVTERVEHERELAEQRERYRRLVDVAPVAIVTYDDEGDVLFANDATAELVGVENADALVGTSAVGYLHPEEHEQANERIRRILEDREQIPPNETRVVDDDGEVRHVLTTSIPITVDGEPAVQTVLTDITEQKEREAALQRYKTVFDTIEDGVYVLDPEFDFVEVNDAYAEMAGRSREELVGEPCSITIDDEVSARAADLVDEMVTGEREGETLEGDIVTPEGERVPSECRFTALLSEDGENVGSVGVVRDLTERKEYERTLETRARQQDVVSNLGQRALESSSLEDLFDEAVQVVADTLGTDYATVLELREADDELLLRAGVGWRDGLVGEATVDADADSQAGYTLESSTPVVVDDTAAESRFNGPRLVAGDDVSTGISTVIGQSDDPWGVLGTHDTDTTEFTDQDVSFVRSVANILTTAIERARYEERLNETVTELRESNERLEQFAYIASHDLQEPLRMISNYLQLLEGRYADELDEDANDFIGFAVDGAERMKEMIDGLLAYSRVETEAEPLEPVEGETVVTNVLEDLQLRIEETDADLAVGDLPTVVADRNQLEQVFRNLVSNALKYRGDEPPSVEIDAERGEREWVFRVADDGIGIAPEHAGRIFEVFKRLHTREEYSGTGIGLALCEKIIDRHEGRIWVESELGEGASFYFTLPFEPRDED